VLCIALQLTLAICPLAQDKQHNSADGDNG
jgi:hypothetical protein